MKYLEQIPLPGNVRTFEISEELPALEILKFAELVDGCWRRLGNTFVKFEATSDRARGGFCLG